MVHSLSLLWRLQHKPTSNWREGGEEKLTRRCTVCSVCHEPRQAKPLCEPSYLLLRLTTCYVCKVPPEVNGSGNDPTMGKRVGLLKLPRTQLTIHTYNTCTSISRILLTTLGYTESIDQFHVLTHHALKLKAAHTQIYFRRNSRHRNTKSVFYSNFKRSKFVTKGRQHRLVEYTWYETFWIWKWTGREGWQR